METMETSQLVAEFKDLQRRLWLRRYLMSISSFDGATVAPENGAAARAEAQGALAGEYHELLCSAEAQDLVAALQRAQEARALDAQTADELRVFARDQREAVCIPTAEEEAWAHLVSEATAVWHKAKPANDWDAFAPYIDRLVAALKQRAARIDPARDPYDVLLDQFERGRIAAFRWLETCSVVTQTAANPYQQAPSPCAGGAAYPKRPKISTCFMQKIPWIMQI